MALPKRNATTGENFNTGSAAAMRSLSGQNAAERLAIKAEGTAGRPLLCEWASPMKARVLHMAKPLMTVPIVQK
jgi:hypothetical protein